MDGHGKAGEVGMKEWIIPDDFVDDETRMSADGQGYLQELIRCKNCKYGKHIVSTVNGEVILYRVFCVKPYVDPRDATHEPDWFCADGKPKSD